MQITLEEVTGIDTNKYPDSELFYYAELTFMGRRYEGCGTTKIMAVEDLSENLKIDGIIIDIDDLEIKEIN